MTRVMCILVYTALVASCSEETQPTQALPSSDTAPGYVQLQRNLFGPSCASGACHGGPRGVAGLAFEETPESYRILIDATPTNPIAARTIFTVLCGTSNSP